MNKRYRALLALAAMVFLAGCGIFGGGGEIDEEDLLGDQEYDWESNSTVTFDLDISSSSYTAVTHVENRTSIEVFNENLVQGQTSVSIESLQFRYENGTVINATHPQLRAIEGSDETTIEFPDERGAVAFTAARGGKSWATPAFVDGEYRVDLPESTRVGIWGLSQTSPTPDETVVEDDQMSLFYADVEEGDSISIRYYLVRDLYLFGGLAALSVSIGAGGIFYYYRQIRRAKQKREDVGLDIDMEQDDIDDEGPPPGMR